jgi:hypothetical protein
MPRIPALVLAAGLALPGCSAPTGLVLDGPLAIRASGGALRLSNESGAPIYTVVVERESAALFDWAPCVDPAACDAIPANGERRVPYGEIAGYEDGEREAIVYWWHLEARAGGGFQPDEIRTAVVRL